MSTAASVKRRTYEVLEVAKRRDRLSQTVQWFIIGLIILNVAAFMLVTVPTYSTRYGAIFLWFERLSVAVFTTEYLLRVWACTENERFAGRPVLGRLRFMVTPAALIDVLAILPFYIPRLVGGLDFRALRALRLFRLLRLLKLGRFSQSIVVFSNVMKNKRDQIFVAGIVVSILLVLASSMMYVAEHRAQPEAFSSIPAAMWWGAITLTTVGYGDVTPVTTAGRVLGGVIAVLGIGLFALPAGILSSGFEEALEQFNEDEEDEDDESEGNESGEDENGDRESAAAGDDQAGDDQAEADPASAPNYCPHCGERLTP
jgi:voltage-gated potassium channel